MYYIQDADYETAKANGISATQVYQRVNTYNWTIERAITQPVRKLRKFESEYLETAIKNGISWKMFYSRVQNLGWDELKAATTPPIPHHVRAARYAEKSRRFDKEQLATMAANGIRVETARARITQYGWTTEDAITTPTIPAGERRYGRERAT